MLLKMKVLFVFLIFVVMIAAEELNRDDEQSDFHVARKKKSKFPFHFLGYGFGIHALGILYWLKVKAVIISFIVGTAVVWGFRYFSQHFKSCPEVIHEGPVIPYEHGYHGHDHISYSSPHGHDHISYSSPHEVDHDPYGGYPYGSSHEVVDDPHHHRASKARRTSRGRKTSTEEQVSDIIFTFLGVGTDACRKRFLCEMEFRANDNPLTEMAFRVIGRGVFFKYVRKEDEKPIPRSFQECAKIHSECEFIEENINRDETNVSNKNEKNIIPITEMDSSLENQARANKYKKSVKSVAEAILRRPNV